MRAFSQPGAIAACVVLAMFARPAQTWAVSDTSPAREKFEQALGRTENLHLPLNRAYLYRQAANAISQKDKAEAVLLLKRALSEIDASDLAMQASGEADDQGKSQLVLARRSTILQLLRIDTTEAMRLLAPPQAADGDMDLQRQIFDRVASERAGAKSAELVRDAAQRKLEYGVTPAVVAAYDVLRRRDTGMAKLFGASIVFRLKTIDPAQSPLAVASAFSLLKLQQSGGGRDGRTNLNASLRELGVVDFHQELPRLLDADSLATLYEFLGDAFLEAIDPAVLSMTEKPAAYMQAMQQYAPEKADELTQALNAAKNAAPAANTEATDKSDAEALTPDEQRQKEAVRAQVQARLTAQIRDTSAQTKVLSARISQTTLTQKEHDDAVFAVVEVTNRSISLGRALAKDLEPEAFKNGELEFYGYGLLSGVVESVSSVLQRYAMDHPTVAEDAASRLDGPEVQTEVELQIAIREMNRRGGEGFPGDRGPRMRRMLDDPRPEMPQ